MNEEGNEKSKNIYDEESDDDEVTCYHYMNVSHLEKLKINIKCSTQIVYCNNRILNNFDLF